MQTAPYRPSPATWSLFAGTTAAHLLGMALVPVLEVDSAQYASIAREMAETGQWLSVRHLGADYLDKPPLLFWAAAGMFKVFGFHHFLFRLPAFLATLLGVFAVYRMGRRLYGPEAATVGALSLYGCQAWFLMAHDLRTDTMLAAAVAVATWQFWEYLETRRWGYLFGGATALAAALLAKGPIGAVVPAMALSGHLLAKGRWRELFLPQWLLAGAWALLLLGPMLWGLWLQYGAEGWYFFFWKQSFGRITGENEWKNDSGFFFLWHTFLWAFLPGTLAVALALGRRAVSFRKGLGAGDMLPVAGFLLPLLALSISKYKLPHYGFVAFPFAALLVAEAYLFFEKKTAPNGRWMRAYQGLLLALSAVLAGVLGAWAFPCRAAWPWALFAGAWLAGAWLLAKGGTCERAWMPGLWALLAANLFLNTHVYPALLEYQAGVPIARFLRTLTAGEPVGYYRAGGHSLDFYAGRKHVARLGDCPPGMLLVTDEAGLADARAAGRTITVLGQWPNFSVSRLNARFLDPQKRAAQTRPWYVVRVD